MATPDDEYLAPVINLFGDRSGTQQSETTATASSSGESAAFEAGDSETVEATASAASATVAAEPPVTLRALPTMTDFNSTKEIERDVIVESSDSESGPEPLLEQSKAQRRQARDGFSEISRVSMRALARRGMSSYEMMQFLGTREFESDEVNGEIERLESCGLLDDAALAETLTRTLRERKKLGASAIRAELRRRKIDQEHISAVLDDDRDEEQERATEIALKRAPQLRSLDGVTAKRRLTGFLMRKGYSGSVVSAAVAAALAPGSGESSGGPVFR
ncbi:MAG: regulatory protein RecX [Rhodoglobus sp.]